MSMIKVNILCMSGIIYNLLKGTLVFCSSSVLRPNSSDDRPNMSDNIVILGWVLYVLIDLTACAGCS